jgi:hypothetical protein
MIIAGLVFMGVVGVTLLAPKLQLKSRLVLPTGNHIRMFRRDYGRHRSDAGTACFHISACKGLRGKTFTKEASLDLVVSAGLRAICLTASRQFS